MDTPVTTTANMQSETFSLCRIFTQLREQAAGFRTRRTAQKVFDALEADDTAGAIKLLTACPAALHERNDRHQTPFESTVFNSRKVAAASAIAAAFPAVLAERGALGETVLLQAARYGTGMALDLLITLGAKLDDTDNNGNTALHYAMDGLPMPVLGRLLKEGLNPNARNHAGETPLMTGVRRQTAPDFITLIAFHGADVHAVDNNGVNATMQAIRYSMLDSAAALMKLHGIVDFADNATEVAKVVANMEVNATFLIQLEATRRDQPLRLARQEAEAREQAARAAQQQKQAERGDITAAVMNGTTAVRGMKTVRFARKGAQKP
ncbi:MAG: hypothetical protein PW788_01960 [Micavibrio sp.]|nr:hypothetical protein [Micavibrio sp.]